MTEEATLILDIAEEKMNKALEHLVEALLGIRAGKASPNVLKGIMVDYYGSQTPVSQVASVTVPDAKTILIQPWEKGMIPVIEKAILVSNIGLTPSNNGEHIRLSIPALTEERRREIAKQIKALSEDAKVAARNVRRDAMDALKKMKTAKEISEDECASQEKEVEKIVSKYMEQIDKHTADKEKEIMSV